MESEKPEMEPPPQTDLASAVRQLQRRGVKDSAGKTWMEWLESQPKIDTSDGTKTGRGKGRGKGKAKSKTSRPSFDPRKHSAELLNTFIDALPEQEQKAVHHSFKRAQRRRKALAQLEIITGDQCTSKHGKTLSRLISLIKHTQAHPSFDESYNSICSHEAGWLLPKIPKLSGTVEDIEDILIGIDCEMVATADDNAALARISVVDGRCNVILDRFVAPDSAPTDLRTSITGITPKDLEGLQYTREDARADLLKLVKPGMVFVGHTLDKDLTALRLDVPLVVDVSLLYGVEGMSSRRPALVYMMEAVLGHDTFRGDDGQHDSANDADAAMRILLHRLVYPLDDVDRVILPRAAAVSRGKLDAKGGSDVDQARILYTHRVPDKPGMFTALVALFATVSEGMGAQCLEGIEMHEAKKGWRSANAIFKNAAEAERVFLALGKSDLSGQGGARLDRAGRPQKLVELEVPGGETASIYVRTLHANSGLLVASRSKQSDAKMAANNTPRENAPASSKKRALEWTGWEQAIEEELSVAGGALPWKRLRDTLVARCREAGAASNQGDEELGNQALACIPDLYLSKADALVRKDGDRTF